MRKFIYSCMKLKIFTTISRMWERKSIEEIASLRRGLALVYALCGTQALFYVANFVEKNKHPTDPEELKKWYVKKKEVDVELLNDKQKHNYRKIYSDN
ncbi:hypothetical protein ANTRET_LOCUS1210 [Anthophora retusa]